MIRSFAFGLLPTIIVLTTTAPAQTPVTFTFANDESRISETHNIGMAAAWFDMEGDGDLDLYIANSLSPDNLFRQNPDGTFTDVLKEVGADEEDSLGFAVGGGVGVTAVDYDNDGDNDICVINDTATSSGDEPNFFFRNKGDGTFEEIALELGLRHLPFGFTNFTWFDVNGDGRLDGYLPGRGESLDRNNQQSYLMIAQEDGTFLDQIEGTGLDLNLLRKTGPVPFDYDNDGDIDLAVFIDTGTILYRNNGDGTFTDVAQAAGLTFVAFPLAAASGDYDNDGYIDLYISLFAEERNILYHNNGDGTFTDVTVHAGVPAIFVPNQSSGTQQRYFGIAFVDVDNDGWLDLYVAGETNSALFQIRDLLYHNQGDGTFVEIGEAAGVGSTFRNGSVCVGDYNGDGFIDLFATNQEGSSLYRNNGNDNHWVGFNLVGTTSNRSAIGSRVTMRSGNLTQIREVVANSTWASQSSLTAHFGLGQRTRIDLVIVRWPTGLFERFTPPPIDSVVTLTEGTGTTTPLLTAVKNFDAYE